MFRKFNVSFLLLKISVYILFRAKYIRLPINKFSSLSTIIQLPKEKNIEEDEKAEETSINQPTIEFIGKMTKTLTLQEH